MAVKSCEFVIDRIVLENKKDESGWVATDYFKNCAPLELPGTGCHSRNLKVFLSVIIDSNQVNFLDLSGF